MGSQPVPKVVKSRLVCGPRPGSKGDIATQIVDKRIENLAKARAKRAENLALKKNKKIA
jgi:hypothetical protein